MANEFIKVGSHIINLNHIAFINLHGAKYDYETKANISGVFVVFAGPEAGDGITDTLSMTFTGKEAEALRWYFGARFEDDDAPFDVMLEHQLDKDGIRGMK